MASQHWQHLPPYGQGMPQPTYPLPQYRDDLDRARSAARAPLAEHPSGYLGTLNTRRQDRLLEALSRRQAARSYTRGVHAGSRANPEHYVWPPEFGPQNGLKAQAAGVKQRPLTELAPAPRLTNDGKSTPRGVVPPGTSAGSPVHYSPFFRPPWS